MNSQITDDSVLPANDNVILDFFILERRNSLN